MQDFIDTLFLLLRVSVPLVNFSTMPGRAAWFGLLAQVDAVAAADLGLTGRDSCSPVSDYRFCPDSCRKVEGVFS